MCSGKAAFKRWGLHFNAARSRALVWPLILIAIVPAWTPPATQAQVAIQRSKGGSNLSAFTPKHSRPPAPLDWVRAAPDASNAAAVNRAPSQGVNIIVLVNTGGPAPQGPAHASVSIQPLASAQTGTIVIRIDNDGADSLPPPGSQMNEHIWRISTHSAPQPTPPGAAAR